METIKRSRRPLSKSKKLCRSTKAFPPCHPSLHWDVRRHCMVLAYVFDISQKPFNCPIRETQVVAIKRNRRPLSKPKKLYGSPKAFHSYYPSLYWGIRRLDASLAYVFSIPHNRTKPMPFAPPHAAQKKCKAWATS